MTKFPICVMIGLLVLSSAGAAFAGDGKRRHAVLEPRWHGEPRHEDHNHGYDDHGEVDAPYTRVEPGRRVSIEAPFTDVDVDRRRIRIRAPFLDIDIPRRRSRVYREVD